MKLGYTLLASCCSIFSTSHGLSPCPVSHLDRECLTIVEIAGISLWHFFTHEMGVHTTCYGSRQTCYSIEAIPATWLMLPFVRTLHVAEAVPAINISTRLLV